MKIILTLLLSLLSFSAFSQGPVLRGPGTTNTPAAWTNVVLLTVAPETNKLNTDLRAALAQTNINVAQVLNAGSIAYSNGPAFYNSLVRTQDSRALNLSGAITANNAANSIAGDLSGATGYAASNLTVGGQVPVGGIAAGLTNGNQGGYLLELIGLNRWRTYNGALLTGILASAVSGTPAGAPNPFTNSVIGYGDARQTNGISISTGGVAISNALGSVTTTGGTISATTSTGAGATVVPIISAVNSQVALTNAQQWAAIRLSGRGMRTTGSSTNVDFFWVDVPVQGTVNDPNGQLWLYFRNGTNAPASTGIRLDSDGTINGTGPIVTTSYISAGAGQQISWNGRGTMLSPSTTRIQFLANGATAGAQIEALVSVTTNGFVSYISNKLAAATITVGASPFSWTNTSGANVHVYVDGVSVTGTVGINGTTVFNTIGQNTISLQNGEWTVITYTLGTPTATWKPF